jgi:nucleotide-binding universal stress UspA family protein
MERRAAEVAMTAFHRICCPIDFTEGSREALRIAADMARRYGAGLTILHATSAHWPGPEFAVAPPPETEGQGEVGALASWVSEAERLAGAPVSSVLLSAPVADAIVAFARDVGTDLVVLSSHGRTGLQRLVLGSVAETVARAAPCPVLIVRRSEVAAAKGAGDTDGMPA